jgi:short-subunit dehydrogenase
LRAINGNVSNIKSKALPMSVLPRQYFNKCSQVATQLTSESAERAALPDVQSAPKVTTGLRGATLGYRDTLYETFSHIVVTGASSGLGGQIALRYAAKGRLLTLFGRDRTRLEAVCAECRQRGAQTNSIVCDIADAGQVEAALLNADAATPVDLVIANAGIGGEAALAPPWGESGPVARHIFDVNTVGVINTVTPLTRVMVDRGRGCIVVVGSLAGWDGLPDAPAYSASKAAVTAYARGLRRLLHRTGVRVVLVSPGFITTPMSTSLPFATPFAWTADRAAARIAYGIERGHTEITFPLPLRLAATALQFLPTALVDVILRSTAQGRFRK